MKKAMLVAALVLALGLGAAVSAEDAAEEAVAVKVTGVNYCVLCTLAKGAEAAAGFEKLNALKVTEALDADGNAIEGMAGKTLLYVPVKAAAELISGEANAGKTVTVTGKLFKCSGALVVESFSAADGAAADAGDGLDEWDTIGTTTMSKQAVI